MPRRNSSAPVGVYDSGVGGLAVLRALQKRLPGERYIYVADSGHAPYGQRHRDFVEARVLAIGGFMMSQGVKAIVVACNTASVLAASQLRSLVSLPVVAMEPAIKPAVATTKSNVILVMGTSATVNSQAVATLCSRFGAGKRIILQPCPGLVELVEQGDLASERVTSLEPAAEFCDEDNRQPTYFTSGSVSALASFMVSWSGSVAKVNALPEPI